MKIAIPYANGQIFQHFGHTDSFKIYDVANGRVQNSAVVFSEEGGHSALSSLLAKNKVEILICGGIGGGAINALKSLGIKVFGGVQGSADDAAEAYVKGVLNYDPDIKCAHHEEHHGDDPSFSCHSPSGCAHKEDCK
jgi:predicted Fe-Mo cluster-binding NifX family protein